ncbi:hypothetical protein MRX96_048517 [Rhipicephalus microplus]
MLEKEFCTTPSVQEYELAHYRRHRYVVSDDDGSSAEPKSSPQQLCLRERAGGARSSVLARSLQDNENQQQASDLDSLDFWLQFHPRFNGCYRKSVLA